MKARLAIMWLIVLVPLAWGAWDTLQKVVKLFQ
jgi:hypothetical protein